MIFTFCPDIPIGSSDAEVISGEASFQSNFTEYLVVQMKDEKRIFKIAYEYHCSPFREIAIVGSLLLVGHEGHFYLYDLDTKNSLLVLPMLGYFGHLYLHKDSFHVADAEGIYCINKCGDVVWHNKSLGIDGVVIKEFTESEIRGSGDWDPPGGWKDFILDCKTGKNIAADSN
ncbi:hypothetical protein QNI19_14005 [Cytophagaceae bacterium DM2B3-1]|uniref:WG repeat-containing protein n=1 Tax=Xanthocytophaga flava TaxID=3048013 RepID=A0ABT7CK23_9BACT|nr:hypothetical protein [Xanthocytophaga flavus]MDJ1469436.1 hypothetical protein [Xanthocytophaga flavus]MDJ1494052.1 hypothetical protein [Xanthocytophaga flavus]